MTEEFHLFNCEENLGAFNYYRLKNFSMQNCILISISRNQLKKLLKKQLLDLNEQSKKIFNQKPPHPTIRTNKIIPHELIVRPQPSCGQSGAITKPTTPN